MTEEEALQITEARAPLAVRRLKGEYLSPEENDLLTSLDNKLTAYYDSLRPPDPRANELKQLLEQLLSRI